MNVTLTIPDSLARRLGDAPTIARRALQALALHEFGAGRLSGQDAALLLTSESNGHGGPGEMDGRDLVARSRTLRAGQRLKGLDPLSLNREGRC